MAKPKKAHLSSVPVPKKKATVHVPSTGNVDTLRFRFDRVDVAGPWCLSAIDSTHHQDLLLKLRDFEQMTASEAFQGGHPGKDYPLASITKDAQDRLAALSADDEDHVSRLRLTGTRRLYGFRRGNEFSILWWDPEHAICPSAKKNT